MVPALLMTLTVAVATPPAARPLPHRCALVDRGRLDDGEAAVVVVVETPGLSPQALQPLIDALEAEGLSAWSVRIPTGAQQPTALVGDVIPAAMAAFPGRSVALVGHGPAGTLAAQSTLAMPPEQRPAALAMLGSPLRLSPRPVAAWMADQRDGSGPVALGRLAEAAPEWRGMPVVPMLLGERALPLRRLSGEMADTLLAWGEGRLDVDLSALPSTTAVWAGAASRDALAPVESIRPALREGDGFVRYGRAALQLHEYSHGDLLLEPRPARDLAAWVAGQLHQPPPEAP